jgi:hypothetical protein
MRQRSERSIQPEFLGINEDPTQSSILALLTLGIDQLYPRRAGRH